MPVKFGFQKNNKSNIWNIFIPKNINHLSEFKFKGAFCILSDPSSR